MFEIVLFADSQCQSRQCDKRIASTGLEPGIACQQVTVVTVVKVFWRTATTAIAIVELMSRCYQTVVEVVTRLTEIELLLEHRLQRVALDR